VSLSANYESFIAAKTLTAQRRGLSAVPALATHLYPFQAASVAFGLEAGSWGCFLDTGLGKSRCELEWALHAAAATNGRALILTPLAVARQIEVEGRSLGYPVRVIRSQDDAVEGISVCNYDRLHLLTPDAFGAVALDESSVLKNFTGATSRMLVDAFAGHRFRMTATATPAPNDHVELAQQADFLGVLNRAEMLVRWFINDSNDTGVWRLKGHAVEPFFDWMATWARMAGHPRDMGDPVVGFDLPPLEIVRHLADEPESAIADGRLFSGEVSATSLHDVKRRTSEARARVVADLIAAEPDESWVVWCDTDYEADALAAVAPSVREVRGSHSIDKKESTLAGFADGSVKHIASKSAICGYGLNWQHCRRMVFMGRSFSYENWYQAVRRCWRFGQKSPVVVHLVVADGEDHIGRVIDRKADDHVSMRAAMVAAMQRSMGIEAQRKVAYRPTCAGRLPAWMEGR
jgi:hypothetical protein